MKSNQVTRSVGGGSLQDVVRALARNVANARIEALEEAAAHLEMTWTEDEEEKLQGHEVAHALRQAAAEVYALRKAV